MDCSVFAVICAAVPFCLQSWWLFWFLWIVFQCITEAAERKLLLALNNQFLMIFSASRLLFTIHVFSCHKSRWCSFGGFSGLLQKAVDFWNWMEVTLFEIGWSVLVCNPWLDVKQWFKIICKFFYYCMFLGWACSPCLPVKVEIGHMMLRWQCSFFFFFPNLCQVVCTLKALKAGLLQFWKFTWENLTLHFLTS